MSAIRINRFLANAGLGSRRSCEQLVRDGRVSINGRECTELSARVGPEDVVKVGSKVVQAETTLYVLLNKPKSYLCTRADEHGRRTIFELLPAGWPRISHVGRLDKDSEGLLILTNDGDFAQHLTHPRYKVEKEYEVVVDKTFDPKVIPQLLKGIYIEGGRASAESVHRTAPNRIKIVLRQGIKRQIRLMLYAVGYEVKRLRRIRIGDLQIAGLANGEWRYMKPREIEALTNKRARPRKKSAKPSSKRKPSPRKSGTSSHTG